MVNLDLYSSAHRLKIEKRLRSTTSSDLYKITDGGKKLRGVLTCLVFDTLIDKNTVTKDQKDKALDLACVVELIQSLSLAADDIIDQDEIRRGAPSLYTLKGFSTAFLEIISGLSIPYSMVAPYGPEYIEAISQTQRDMCTGVLKEILKDMPATRLYEIVIDKKTGALFSLAARFGAMAAGADEDTVSKISEYGLHLGRAYQILDDVDDFIGVVNGNKSPDSITGTEFILLRGMKIDDILKDWGSDIIHGKPDFTKISQVNQLFGLYDLLKTLNHRLEVEKHRTEDIVQDIDVVDKGVLWRYFKHCL